MRRTFLLVFVCTAALACGGGGQQGGPGGAGAAGGRGAVPAMDVKTITIAAKPIPQTSEFVATIKSLRSTNIQPQVEGFVRQIMVKAGDRVRVGQPLVQTDPEKQQATVSATQSQRASREADLEFARQQLGRMQKLFDAGAVSRADLEQAETAVKTAQAQLEAVNSQIRENEVLAAAGLDHRVSLAFLDVNEVRERLERVPMIKSAAVRKLYPNELVITLQEREPHAIWQLNGELFVIAADGTVIDLMQDERFVGLPLVVGDQANTRNKDYLALLEAAARIMVPEMLAQY